MLRARDEKIAEDQRIHLRTQEAIDRFFRPANDRLVVVEGSVEHDGHAREIAESGNERVIARSEEHTSELQSHLNLVCRLLLEKKKKKKHGTKITGITSH